MKQFFTVFISAVIMAACSADTSSRTANDSVSERVQKARERNDGPAIWVAKDHDSTLYLYGLMEAAANNGELTIGALDRMQPWLAAEYLTFAATQNAGLSAELSADVALKSRAVRAKKNVVYLESMETQIRASSDLPDYIQIDILTETMEQFGTLGTEASQIADQWSIGGTDFLTDKLIRPMKARAPEVFNSLLRDRNRAWATKLARFMEEDSGTGFVAVGTAHLLGEDSLVHELREQGYEVKRYFAFKGENVIETVDAKIDKAR